MEMLAGSWRSVLTSPPAARSYLLRGSISTLGRQKRVCTYASASGQEVGAKAALVTGANTGLGFETAKELAFLGYSVVLACRDVTKGQKARDAIKREVPAARVEAVALDLADLESIKSFGKKAQDAGRPLDVLCNNAGIMACPELRTADGFEMQLGVNHLGHFLLTSLLLPLMRDSNRPARIVNVSSAAHLFGKINFEDLNSRHSYSPWPAYGQSKLANILFTYELAKRLPVDVNVTVNALHPGVVNTELQRFIVSDKPPFWQVPFLLAARAFLKSPKDGASTAIYLCSSQQVEGRTSEYWVDSKPQQSSSASYDAQTQHRLWEISQELTGAEFSI